MDELPGTNVAELWGETIPQAGGAIQVEQDQADTATPAGGQSPRHPPGVKGAPRRTRWPPATLDPDRPSRIRPPVLGCQQTGLSSTEP